MKKAAESKRYGSVPPAGQLSGCVRVICDLHLKGSADPLQARFLEWLTHLPEGESLWILGDLFEYWLGGASMGDPELVPVLEALRRRTQAGDFVGFVPGNRDFLIGAEFGGQTGVSVYPEGALLEGPGGGWLLLHGDEFCTLDHGYQRLRRVLRSGVFRFWAKHQPAFLSRAMARRLRVASKRAVPAKDPARMEMQTGEALEAARAAGAQAVLCGHAHVLRDEKLGAGADAVRFIVLDAFGHGSADVLEFRPGRDPALVSSTAS